MALGRSMFEGRKKSVSEVGFEPTPTFVDQNTRVSTMEEGLMQYLESGALDRSAILTTMLKVITLRFCRDKPWTNMLPFFSHLDSTYNPACIGDSFGATYFIQSVFLSISRLSDST